MVLCWLSTDPLAEKYANASPYNYCLQNPINLIDPTGMSAEGPVIDPPAKNNRKAGSIPIGMSEKESLSQLTTIDGKQYHKNTGSLIAELGNKINSFFGGSNDYFVEHKEYDKVADNFIHEAVDQGVGYLAGGVVGKVVGKGLVAITAAKTAQVATEGGSTIINSGIQITEHGASRMIERGITEGMVETAISKGQKFYDPLNNSYNFILKNGFASGKSLLVGTNTVTGEVTTVIASSKNLIKPRMISIK